MDKKFYVTTPIYYVNAEPHIGHAYTTVLADFMNKFYALLGYDTYFLTGTDEHGDKIAQAASEHNVTPAEYTTRISNIFKKTWEEMGIGYSDFIRTTEERHIRVVTEILKKVYDRGDIYFGSYGGHYCVGCERFFTEKEIIDGKCPDHGTPLEYIEEKNYFFKMSKYQEWLVTYIENHPDFIRPIRYRNEVLSLLKSEELDDLCISRPKSRLTWGIPLPFDDSYVTYVWFDALINYISAPGYPDDEKFTRYWPAVQHIIAKDILKPHGIFWPTMLHSAGIDVYQHLNVHGYWNIQDAKMSKSLGNVVTPADLVARYGNDQVRYFFLREMIFGNDAKFNEEVIINRINFDLANDLGNLINRTFNMAKKYFGGLIPGSQSETNDIQKLKDNFLLAGRGYIEYVKKFETSNGLGKLWEFIRYLNKYIDINKPWQLAKEKKEESLAAVIRNILEGIYAVSVLLSPVLVSASKKIISALNADDKPRDLESMANFDLLDEGSSIAEIGILFPRLEYEKKESFDSSAANNTVKQKAKKMEDNGIIDFKEFSRVDIRVAKVLSAEKVEGSDKLLELSVDSGMDERTIIAGLAKYYSPEYLTGKKILVVINLKPAVIFKKKSNGMLLAAIEENSGKPNLIEIGESVPVGSKIG